MTLLTEWERLKNQLDSADAKVLSRLINAYELTFERIDPQIEALIELMTAQLVSGKLTKASVSESVAYKNLINSIKHELDDYGAWLKTEIDVSANQSAKAGLSSGAWLILAALAEGLHIAIKDVPREMVENAPDSALAFLKDYLDPRGALFAKIQYLSGYHSVNIADGILEQVAQGVNPQDIAEWITDSYGVGLTDSMRMMRTTQLYSYRKAAAAVQVANKDVLQGVVWCAELDDKVCESCVSLNGQVFEVGTICNDHHNGRCALLPWVIGMDNPIKQTGEDWFKEQSEANQVEIMGKGKHAAWKEGKFDFKQLTKEYDDPVFGVMKGSASLKDLVNNTDVP